MKRILFIVLLFWGANAIGQSKYTTGADLREYCGAAIAGESGARAGLCVGFIDGFRQFNALAEIQAEYAELTKAKAISGSRPIDISRAVTAANSSTRFICIPEDATNGQLIKIVVKYLDRHPERLHIEASYAVFEALQDAFPCPVPKS